MFYGIIIGVVLGALIGLLVGISVYDNVCKYDTLKGWIAGIAVCLVISIPISFLGKYINITDKESYLARYKTYKSTYINSLNDTRISGLERIELTKSIMSANTELADQKININKMWNFEIPHEIKNEILKLEEIK